MRIRKTGTGKYMRKLLWVGAAGAILLPAYFLFEPLFVWSQGWKDLGPAMAEETGDQEIHQPGYDGVIARAHDVLVEARRDLNAPGISVAIGMQGRLVWSEALGFSDVEARRPATTRSSFRLGSTSKALTSVAVGTLLDRGALKLDAPIGMYAPYLPETYGALTTRQVMSHMAGVRDYGLCLCFPIWEYYNRTQYDSIREGLGIFTEDALLFEPGTRFAYTSFGYNLTAAVIEGVTGTDFLSYMNEAVYAPLGMSGTSADHADREMPNRATFYDVEDGKYKRAYPVNNSNKWPSGGIVSTPSDLVLLGNALLTDRFLQPATKDMLFEPQRLADGKVNRQQYALGWRHHQTWELFGGSLSAEAVHHQGVANGSTSVFVLLPEYGLVLSLVMNSGVAPSGGITDMVRHADAIAETFIGACAWDRLPEDVRSTVERRPGCRAAGAVATESSGTTL